MAKRRRSEEIILDDIRLARQRNIRLFAEMSSLADVPWTSRRPGDPDVTLELIRAALQVVPMHTCELLRQVLDNDAKVDRLTRELIKVVRGE